MKQLKRFAAWCAQRSRQAALSVSAWKARLGRIVVAAVMHPNLRNEFVHYVALLGAAAVFFAIFFNGGFKPSLVAQLPQDRICRPLTIPEEESGRALAMTGGRMAGIARPSCYEIAYDLWPYAKLESYLKHRAADVQSLEIYPELHTALIKLVDDDDAGPAAPKPGKIMVGDPAKLIAVAQAALAPNSDAKVHVLPAAHVQDFPSMLWLFFGLLVVATIARVTISVTAHAASLAAFKDIGKGAKEEAEPKARIQRVPFDDVAGCDEAIARLQRIIKWQKRPGLYRLFRTRPPKGILMVGPPGTGKTWLARALAGALGDVNIIICSGSEFVNKYVGVGAATVRGKFDEGRALTKKNGKLTIIVIDELDALGRQRSGDTTSGGSMESDTTVNQLLTEMDGFSPDENIIVVGMTNRPEILDSALKRQGRIDYTIAVDRPDCEGRHKLLLLYTKDKPLAADVNLLVLAKIMSGMVGADIKGICNEAGVQAADRLEELVDERIAEISASDPALAEKLSKALVASKDEKIDDLSVEELKLLGIEVTMADFTEAIDVIRFGDKLHSKQKNQLHNSQYNTAVHESGHSGVCHKVCKDPVGKVTRIMRSKSLGMVQVTAEAETYGYTEEWLKGQMMMAFGGCLAQEVILDVRDSGLDSDLAQASKLARYMAGRWGMSKLGKISLKLDEEGYPACYISESLRAKFDEAWTGIIDECYKTAEAVVREIENEIVYVADVLMEEETMEGDRFREVFKETPEGAKENSEHLRMFKDDSAQPARSFVAAESART